MQILNIDDFAQITRQITYRGVTYSVEEVNVQQFIDNLKAAEKLEADNVEPTLSGSFEQGVTAIRQAIPTMGEEIVRTLKLTAMTAILKFIRGEMDDQAAPQEAAGDGDDAKKPT